ncbi:unnamed protein product [Durusdinium trenchii]|uniref:Chaperone DnaJ C-terminal domain-containing protein n=1 Tax=Durusdinium trenchii TaxID=1381693 RepID=A0ABP0S242_9DINO
MAAPSQAASLPRPSARRSRDVILPLHVPLEQLVCGAIRHIQVLIPRGAPDGHRITFTGKAGPGDVIFVLQELPHPTWARRGADLFVKKSISLYEALAGSPLVIEHLDGQKLLVHARPGEVWDPRDEELDHKWLRFDGMDAFAGQDATIIKTSDLESCKEFCRRNGWSGFTYWENAAYFRAQDRTALLENQTPTRGCILFVCPERTGPLQRAILNEGMPQMSRPGRRGDLFVLLHVEWPEVISDDLVKILRDADKEKIPAEQVEDNELEEFELCDLDLLESRPQLTTGPDCTEDEPAACPAM